MPADKAEPDIPAKKFKFKCTTSGSRLISQDDIKVGDASIALENKTLEIIEKDGNKTLLEETSSKKYPFKKIPQPLSKKINTKKTKSQLDAKLDDTREIQNHKEIESKNISYTQPKVSEASSFLGPISITPVKRSSFSSRGTILTTKMPSNNTNPKINFKTCTATPVASVSMSQLTPRPTSSQGFECLSLSSILEDIGYEESQIRNIVPATPIIPELQQNKRKLDNEHQTCLDPESPGKFITCNYAR